MASEAQIQANRANAQKSTGPRTADGKAVVAQNAVRHGLAARLEVIRGEDQAEFDRHREGMLDELAPVGAREMMLAERVVGLSWRLDRAGHLQNEVFDALLGDRSSPLARSLLPEGTTSAHEEPQAEGELTRGQVVLEDFSNGRVLDRLLLYERRIERSFYNAMRELRDLQRLPQTAGVPAGAAPPAGRAGGGPAVRDARSRVSAEVGGRPSPVPEGLSAVHSRVPQEVGGRPLQIRDGLSGMPSCTADEVGGGALPIPDRLSGVPSCVAEEFEGGPLEPWEIREALSAMRSRVAAEVDREMPAGALIPPRGLSWGTPAEVAASVQIMMDELRRTDPIGPEPAGGQLARAQGMNELCRTKPICAEPERGQVAGAQGVAANSRESKRGGTNPISPEPGHLACGEGMNELCRTKPISPEPARGQVAGAQAVTADSRPSACRETKPISARGSRTSNIRPAGLRALMGTP
jgi:hypothetical protein